MLFTGRAAPKYAGNLTDEEPFERFFGEVFRHHSGRDMAGDGEGVHPLLISGKRERFSFVSGYPRSAAVCVARL